MSEGRGGFLIYFDETQRASFLREVRSLEDGFSDALSSQDWKLKEWEVCGLLFEHGTITHWALARKRKKIVTGKARVEFTEVTPTSIDLREIENRIGSRFESHLVRTRSGVGGKVPAGTWSAMKGVLRSIDHPSFEILDRLERLRDQSRSPIEAAGVENVAQQRDAVGLALDVFDKAGYLRKKTLSAWAAPDSNRLSSFLEGLGGVRTIEDQLIAHDAAVFPGATRVQHTIIGAVFGIGHRKLEVFNVNRTAIETSLGVDLLYFNEEFAAWTLVQYKSMNRSTADDELSVVYRPDASFNSELARMQKFRDAHPDKWDIGDRLATYRLCSDGLYFKFCSRIQLEVLSDNLLPGMYLPREFVECLLAGQTSRGQRGGKIITFKATERHVSNTLFASLVRDAWVGTRGVSSARIAAIVREKLVSGRAVVLARSRPPEEDADLESTLEEFGIQR